MKRKIFTADHESGTHGSLHIEYLATDSSYKKEPPEDQWPEEPMDMIGKPIHFLLKINYALDLPEDLAHDVRIEYTLPDSDKIYKTEVKTGSNPRPNFDYVKEHKFKKINDDLFQKLTEDAVVLKIWGRENMQSIVRFNTMVQLDLKQMVVESPEKLQKLQAKREEVLNQRKKKIMLEKGEAVGGELGQTNVTSCCQVF